MVKAIDIIQREHRALAAVVHCLDQVVGEIREGRLEPDYGFFGAAIDYIREFPDHFHHPKEDDYLFPAVAKRSPGTRKVIHDLKQQHAKEERLVADLRWKLEAWEKDPEAGQEPFLRAIDDFVAYQRNHIALEEREIIPAAREHLRDSDWRVIDAAFADNRDPIFGASPKAAYDRLFSRIVSLAPAPHGLAERHEPHAKARSKPGKREELLDRYWI